MILIIFGIYALIAAKLQISRHYGLKGTGARIAGAVCFAFGLGFFTLFSVPIFAVTRSAGLPRTIGRYPLYSMMSYRFTLHPDSITYFKFPSPE
jgi:hypothetical protein